LILTLNGKKKTVGAIPMLVELYAYTDSLRLNDGLTYNFFYFTMVQKQYTFNRNCTSNFEFGSWPSLVIGGVKFSCAAGPQW